ncbi:hypothetical protein SprV_0401588000 [Sparganum proliferum]
MKLFGMHSPSANPRTAPSSLEKYLLRPSDAKGGSVDAPTIAALAAAELRSRPEARQDMLVTGAVRDTHNWADYRLVISKMRPRLQIRRRPQGKRTPCKLNTALLNVPTHRSDKQVVNTRICFDDNDEVRKLLAEKNRLHKVYMNCRTDSSKVAISRCRRFVQQRPRGYRASGSRARSRKSKDTRTATKRLTSLPPTRQSTAPVEKQPCSCSAQTEQLLMENSEILKRWAEHFRSVLKRPSNFPSTLPGTIGAMHWISSGKAPGFDVILADIYKHGRPRLMDKLTTIFQGMWRQGKFSQDFMDATFVHLYK